MKLILTQEVTGLGTPGDVVEVKDGYGRNYLIPRGFAMKWTRGGQKQVDSIRRARAVREVRDVGQAQELADNLRSLQVTLPARVGRSGRLFGSITAADIADAVTAAGGPSLDKRRIELRNPIKTVGAHQVTIRLHPEVSAAVDIEVSEG